MAILPLTRRKFGIPLTLLLAVLSALFQPASAPASIFGEDDRVTEGRTDFRFRPVGMVRENARYGFATAFLVDDCHALTAKHVIHHSHPIGRTVILRFEPWRRSSPSNTTEGVVVAAGGTPTAKADVSEDWALLQLSQCLGRTIGFFRLSTVQLKIQTAKLGITPSLIAVGYPNDQKPGSRPTFDPRCEVRLITSYGLLHDCATLPGNSGGPIIGWNDDREQFEVFAINVAGNHDPAPRKFDMDAPNMAVAVQPILPILESLKHREHPRTNQPN